MNLERIEALLELVSEAEVAELVVEGDGWRVGARKGAGQAPLRRVAPEIPAPVPPVEEPGLCPVTATLVGRFRAATPALRPGDLVEAGQALGGIESMGILNLVVAPEAGRIAAVAVAEGQGVQYGQELFTLTAAEAADEEDEG